MLKFREENCCFIENFSFRLLLLALKESCTFESLTVNYDMLLEGKSLKYACVPSLLASKSIHPCIKNYRATFTKQWLHLNLLYLLCSIRFRDFQGVHKLQSLRPSVF